MTDKPNKPNKKLGRPRLFEGIQQKLTITLPSHYAQAIRELGKGNLSRGVRLLFEHHRNGKE